MYFALPTLACYVNETIPFESKKRLRDALIESHGVFARNRIKVFKKTQYFWRNESDSKNTGHAERS
jgi:hypothetical protein